MERGEVLVRPHTLSPTQVIDAYLEYLPSAQRSLKHRTNLRFHAGTALTTASVFLLDRDELAPGEGGWVQFRLDRPLVTMPQDRFVIRTSSAIQTVGGGVILDTQPAKHKRYSSSVAKDLTVLLDGPGEQILGLHVRRSGPGGVSFQELAGRIAMSPKEIQTILQKMVERREILVVDSEKMKVVAKEHCQHLREAILTQLTDFHQRFPMKLGFAKEELRTKLPPEMDVRLFQRLLSELIESEEVVLDKEWLRLSSHQVSSADERGLIKRVEEALLRAGLQPASPKELAEEWSEAEAELQTVFDYLAREGLLVRIKNGMYFHKIPFGELKEKLIAYLKTHQEITTPQFKEITAASRKFAIPLIEYFDQIKLTLRLGDKRVFRSTSQSSST
jgi:selenocysteine-specific elongation factor